MFLSVDNESVYLKIESGGFAFLFVDWSSFIGCGKEKYFRLNTEGENGIQQTGDL